jgi:hypothetical protein
LIVWNLNDAARRAPAGLWAAPAESIEGVSGSVPCCPCDEQAAMTIEAAIHNPYRARFVRNFMMKAPYQACRRQIAFAAR